MDKSQYARLIDGETRLMGVLGEGIAYTMSPRLHNYAANRLGQSVAYLPIDLPAKSVKAFLQAAWDMGAVGFSVTKPHKQLVARLVGAKLSSVNTLYRGKKWWQGASTDGEGFAAGLARLGTKLSSFEDIVVIGSGGATLALLQHAATLKPKGPTLTVLRRSAKGDAALKKVLPKKWSPRFAKLGVKELASALAGKGQKTLLIQASSAPQAGDDLKALTPALEAFGGVVCDLVYGKPSALYFAAVAKDLLCQDGEAMLIEQARLAQKLWWGKALPYDDMAVALRGK